MNFLKKKKIGALCFQKVIPRKKKKAGPISRQNELWSIGYLNIGFWTCVSAS